MNYPFRRVMSAAAFVAGISAVPAAAQLVPNPADVATVGIGPIQTARPADGQTLVGVNIGDTRHQEGSSATATLLGPGAAVDANFANVTTTDRTQLADVVGITAGPVAITRPNDGGSAVTLGLASGGTPVSVGAGGRTVPLPGWSGLPGLPNLPFAMPKSAGR